MEQFRISDFKLGIMAGGQLGKMLAMAAMNWDIKTYVLDPDPHCPAAHVASGYVQGNYKDYHDVYRFGKEMDMVTFEIEHVNTDALKQLQKEGVKMAPDPGILELIQDKGAQKDFYRQQQLPTADYQLLASKAAITQALAEGSIQFPFVQKLRRGGFDGRGVAVIRHEQDLDKLLDGPSVVEKQVAIDKEIAVIVARNASGEAKTFPPVDMVFNPKANLVEKLVCPAAIAPEHAQKAEALAIELAHDLQLTGLLAVEFFIDKQGELWINEAAPRPHNSGHHTIEALITSQYEQHLRAILDVKLGSTEVKIPSVMINLLGEPGYEGVAYYEGLGDSMAIPGVKIHLYGKRMTRPYRKMGNVTILDTDVQQAFKKADQVKHLLKVKT